MNRRGWQILLGALVAIGVLGALPSLIQSAYWTHILVLCMIWALIAVSLRALARTGLLSMGTAGFMLVGAYSSALLVLKGGLNVWPAMLLGGLIPAALALVVGYPFLRAKGIYFAILTVMMSEVLRSIAWYWSSLTGGSSGLRGIPDPEPITLPGIATLTFESRSSYYYLTLVLVVICLIILYRIEHSWLGGTWEAINANDILAQSSGINVRRHKVIIFVVTAFFTGFAGALYAHYMGSLSPYGTAGSPFSFTASIYTIIFMMVGGERFFIGPIIGAYILTIIPEVSRGIQQYIPLLFGGLLIIVVFFIPQGLLGLGERCLQASRKILFESRKII